MQLVLGLVDVFVGYFGDGDLHLHFDLSELF